MNPQHPGCYGLPSAVSASCRSCVLCPVRGGCVFDAEQLLASMPNNPLTQRERLALSVTRQALVSAPPMQGRAAPEPTVVASVRGVKRISLNAQQLDEIARLPARVASQVKTLMERGWFVYAKGELRAGRNPADKGWKKVLCQLLLRGGGSRAELELAFCQQLDMSAGSARMQASAGLAIFAAGRLATERFGRIELSPN